MLLFITAAGGALFSQAPDVPTLILGRALIGMGVASAMAVAFKAFSQFFLGDRLPFLNGLGLAAGGVGLKMGTWPVEISLEFTDWRGVVLLVSALCALIGLVIFAVVPKGRISSSGESFKKQPSGLRPYLPVMNIGDLHRS